MRVLSPLIEEGMSDMSVLVLKIDVIGRWAILLWTSSIWLEYFLCDEASLPS